MKGLKKIALVTAIAAAPMVSNADLRALDDSAMGNVTGQSGVTIELATKVDIGSFTYTDDGSFRMDGIHIGGGSVTRDGSGNVDGVDGLLDDLLVKIDIEDSGNAVIDVDSISGAPVDFAVGVESASLQSTDGTNNSTLLASNIAIQGSLADLKLTVETATDTLVTDVVFNVNSMDMDVNFLGIGIRGMSITGADTFGATYADANGTSASPYAGLFAAAQLKISKATGVAGSASGEALQIEVPEFIADVSIAETQIGGTSIGTIAMDNVAITQTSMKIYGH